MPDNVNDTCTSAYISKTEHLRHICFMSNVIYTSIYSTYPESGNISLYECLILNGVLLHQLDGDLATVSGLAKEFGLPQPTVSRYVKKHLDAKNIAFVPHPADGRKRFLFFPEAKVKKSLEWADTVNKGRHQAHENGQPLTKLYKVK